ncbi:GFA family protein [Acidovorax sp.]|uniref:GFA family protein n=1 Tax=Acidovorax sp. TaxID=1872122 RepID=UPI00391F83FC
MQVQGQCHCGAIAYEAEVQPGSMTICHCTDCQVHSGSAFRANISAPAATFRLVKGRPRTYVKTADSGVRRLMAFCEHCGTPLYACAVESPTAYSLRTGAIRQRHGLGTPQRQIWTQRRLPWVQLPQDLEAHTGQP